MSETAAIKEHTSLFDLYDADGCLVGKANPGKKIMLADAFYVPERMCRNVSTRYESFKCSECGCAIYDTSQIGSDRVYYCSDCGAKVVDEL